MNENVEKIPISYEDVPDNAGIGGYSPSFVDVDGVKTRYYDVGDGEPLVLIHGGTWKGYASANSWTQTFDRLSEDFRVIAFDRIGCGLTENPKSPEEFVYDTDIDHGFSFLDELGIQEFHLAGWSRGGGMSSRMAVEAPERVKTLIINNSATLGPPVNDGGYVRSRLMPFEQSEDSDPKSPDYTRKYYEQYSYQTDYITDLRCRTTAYMQHHPKFEESEEVLANQKPGETWQDTLSEHMRLTHTRIQEGVLDMPVLYMYGNNDMTLPWEMAIAAYGLIAANNPETRMNVINKCGHMAFQEHPDEFADRVANFITRHTE